MRSKTFVILTAVLWTFAALTFAGEAPQPADQQPAVADAQELATADSTTGDAESAAPGLQPAGEEVCPAPVFEAGLVGEPCGGTVCGVKEYCCNPTCSLCLPYGMSCTQQAC